MKDRKVMSKAREREVWGEVCERVADGEGLSNAARGVGVARRTVRGWMARDEGKRQEYEAAVGMRTELYQERLVELCARAQEAAGDEGADVARQRVRLEAIKLELDTLKWMLARLMPHKYGDRSCMEISGKDGAPLLPQHSEQEDEAFAQMLAGVQEKLRRAEEARGAGKLEEQGEGGVL